MRDEDTGELWTPTALPIRDEAAPYVARHGQGYSRFEHTAHGIALELLQFVPLDDPDQDLAADDPESIRAARRLSVTAYVEWVLGPSRGASAPVVVTEIDPDTGALLARNPGTPTSARVAFADLGGRQTAGPATGPSSSAATARSTIRPRWATPLSRRVGAGLDPCARSRP